MQRLIMFVNTKRSNFHLFVVHGWEVLDIVFVHSIRGIV